ncbi:MAG: hypothetical protein JXO22_14510 [Phycisphaerae bacterium]|nr:hypothetical protein [Phycisphaerae bacterium]
MFVRTTGIVLMAAVVVTLVGCQTPCARVSATQQDVPTGSSAELMEYIGNQPFVTAETGYRAAHMIYFGEPFDGDFDELRSVLIANDVANRGWKHAEGDALTRSDIGFLICRACNIRTGVNWTLFGLGRYGYRELQYHQIAGPGGEFALVSGGEFQGIVRRADEYQRRVGQAPAASAELGAEPTSTP